MPLLPYAGNEFSEPIHEIGGHGFRGLEELRLSDNRQTDTSEGFVKSKGFSGGIPSGFGDITSLKILEMSHILLNGPIATELGHLGRLEVLDISYNELTGMIPEEILKLSSLRVLNVKGNTR